MAFEKDSLATLLDRTYNNYMSRLKPIEKTPRFNLIKVLASCEAGAYHELLGDLSFLADQIFPDTATGDYLRAHWSDRVPPLYASSATGSVIQTGVAGSAIPAGLVYVSASGKRYYTSQSYTIGSVGSVQINVTAEEAGTESNIDSEAELSISSAIPAGADTKVKAGSPGISGGVDGETDEEYMSRVLVYLRNTTRYGKEGDFAAWAVDSTAEVSKAFEFKNFGVFGALLVQVINGNQVDGVSRVSNLATVKSYIEKLAPPVLFTVRTPELVQILPSISLVDNEDTVENRALVENRLKVYLSAKARPGISFTQALLQSVIVDGVTISEAFLTLPGGKIETTILQYPVLGEITWQ